MPNMWDSRGHVVHQQLFSDWQNQAIYEAKEQWDWDPTIRGFRGKFPTAADDFAVPYVEAPAEVFDPVEEEEEDLIGPIDDDEEDPWDLI